MPLIEICKVKCLFVTTMQFALLFAKYKALFQHPNMNKLQIIRNCKWYIFYLIHYNKMYIKK